MFKVQVTQSIIQNTGVVSSVIEVLEGEPKYCIHIIRCKEDLGVLRFESKVELQSASWGEAEEAVENILDEIRKRIIVIRNNFKTALKHRTIEF